MTYQHVKCPDFITYGPNGVQTIQCKLCGVVIADTVERVVGYEHTRGGQTIKVVNRQLTRFANYREIKIAFEDPLYGHVTHGCANCVSINMPQGVLAELHAADQEESPDGFTDRERAQIASHVSVLKEDQSGIA